MTSITRFICGPSTDFSQTITISQSMSRNQVRNFDNHKPLLGHVERRRVSKYEVPSILIIEYYQGESQFNTIRY